MKKINFQDLPNTDTPIKASTLNQMQSNIEESCVAVSPTQPETNERVWIQKGKNLLDLKKCNFNGCKLNEDGTITSILNPGYYCSVVLKYLNEFLMKNKGKSITLSMGEIITGKNISIVIYGTKTDGSTVQETTENNARQVTCTIAEDFEEITMIEFRFNRSNSAFIDTTTLINYLQLEQGSTATEYEAYVNRKINVDNEKFLDVETMGIETITNENGTAIKFPDGTMICRNTVIHEGVSFVARTDTASGISRIESNSYFDLGNYAQPFIEKPTLICKGSGGTFAEPLEIYGGDDINYIGKCYLWSWTVKSNAIIYLSYIAIGRWK